MRYLLCAAILAGLLGTTPVHAEDDEATLRKFKTEPWPRAYRTGDAALLDRLLHDSFEMIDNDGQRSTKAEELDRVRNSKWESAAGEPAFHRLLLQSVLTVEDRAGAVPGLLNATEHAMRAHQSALPAGLSSRRSKLSRATIAACASLSSSSNTSNACNFSPSRSKLPTRSEPMTNRSG